jgi:diguanylate cyclase (GGDEF)-like protein
MGQNVVIVDDDPLVVRLFASVVGAIPGVTVNPFTSAAAALAWCEGQDIDCFILDQHMPPPDGLEMIRLLRATDAFALVPIVIVTGEHDRAARYRALDAGANDYVEKPVDNRELVARLTTLLALRSAQKQLGRRIDSLSSSLVHSEGRSRAHAERLESLWRIANNPDLPHDDLIQAMLEGGAAAFRPGEQFAGILRRIDGSETVTVAATGAPPPYAEDAQIATQFSVAGCAYELTFASPRPMRVAFGSRARAYVGILAEFFATRMHQQWQAARLREQFERDSLTGLWNRSRFRSLARAAFVKATPAAVGVFDVLHFHQLNETHGHRAGDAVLVEAAAALVARGAQEEIVARVGGDSFAVFLPAVASRQAALARASAYGAAFGQPMAGVAVAAVAGIALAPHDGATLDELLFRAEARANPATPNRERLIFAAGIACPNSP